MDWSPEVQVQVAIFNRLGELIAATIAAASGKAPDPWMWPTPETAAEKVLKRRQDEEYDELLELVEASKKRTTTG